MAVLLKWRFALPVDARTAWAGFSDTDRFNRAAGLGFTFEETPREDGTVARTGSVRKLGMTLTWDELPWEYEAPRWFRIRRRFHGGPVAQVVVNCRVEPEDGGSIVTYEVALTPANPLVYPVVWADAQTSVRPQLDGALQGLVGTLRGEQVRYDPPPEPLSEQVSAEVAERLSRLSHPAVAQGLQALLEHGPITEQDRIQPRRLARRWSVTEDQAVLGCLEAVREGVLTMRWELLCPSCQGPKDQRQTLGEMPVIVHCPSCNIAYDGTFPDSVNVVFRPDERVRTLEVGVACALSPARTPAVIAAALVPAGGHKEVCLEATPGSYRLLPLPGRGTAVLEVSEDAPGAQVEVSILEDGGLEPPVLRVQPGPARLRVRSEAPQEVQLQVKRRWRPPWTLTAGDLFAIDGARALLPPYSLDPGLQVEVGRAAVLVVEAMGGDAASIEQALRRERPHQLYRGDDIVIATWERFESAVRAAEPFAARPDRAAALTVGPVAVLSRDTGVVPSGSAVQEALMTLRQAGATRTALPARLTTDVEVTVALQQASDRVTVGRRPSDGRPALLVFPRRLAGRSSYEADQMVAGIYRVTTLVGKGGMGTVYGAEDLVGGDSVVVKVLRQKLSADPDHVARFYQEARVLWRLDHPRIVRVHDWGQDGHGRLYLAMERLEGRPLDVVMEARGPLPPSAAVPLLCDALDALQAAHQAGVIHRDIKPDNLFCSSQGRCTVLDFGIALDRTGEDLDGEEGGVWGTPRWMAPEQVEGKPLDGRADAYAVALVLYEVLTGAQPFPAGTAMASAMKRTARPPVDIRTQEVSVPEPLAAAIMRQLSLDPDARYADAAAFAAALRSP